MHDVISDVIVWNAGQNISPLLVSVELFENNIMHRIVYAYHTRILFFVFLRMMKYNTRMLELWLTVNAQLTWNRRLRTV